MRRIVALVVAVTAMLAASIAAAEPIAIAADVNSPFRWDHAEAVAGSLHVGFAGHHAIRATMSRFPYADNIGGSIVTVALEPDSEGSLKQGRVVDAGIGYQWFPRKLWSGPTLEAGLLRRTIDGTESYRFTAPENLEVHSVGYAGRALVGWSVLITDHFYFATAAGLAIGRYTGTETSLPNSWDEMEPITGSFTRWDTTAEFYLRVGGALSL